MTSSLPKQGQSIDANALIDEDCLSGVGWQFGLSEKGIGGSNDCPPAN